MVRALRGTVKRVAAALALAGAFLADDVMAGERFAQKITAHSGRVVVLSEGDFEARQSQSQNLTAGPAHESSRGCARDRARSTEHQPSHAFRPGRRR